MVMVGSFFGLILTTLILSHIVVFLPGASFSTNVFFLCPGGSQSTAQFPSRAAEAVWPQWQGQQHAQNHAEQHPHAQGNQQDMFPVSHWR